MKLEQLYALIYTVETRSVRKASELLFMTPQNVSKLIQQIENECNTEFFERTRTGMIPTKEGLKAYKMANRIKKETDEFMKSFSVEDGDGDEKSLAYPVSVVTSYVLQPLINSYLSILYSKFDDLKLRLTVQAADETNSRLMKQNTSFPDIVITNCDKLDLASIENRLSDDYSCYLVYEDRLCLEIPVGHPLSAQDEISVAALENTKVLLFSTDAKGKTYGEKMLERNGIIVKEYDYFPHSSSARNFAKMHNQVTIVTYPSSELTPIAGVVVVPIEGNIILYNLLLINKHSVNKEVVDSFYYLVDQTYDLKRLF